MKFYKGNYGWSTKCWAKKDEENKCYVSVSFPQEQEPQENELEATLILRDKFGRERECYFAKYNDKQGNEHPKLMVKAFKETKQEPKVSFSPDDLPF